MKNLFCTLGLHNFKPWAFNSVVNPVPVERCARCGTGRQWVGHGGQIRYTKEELDEAARAASAKPTAEVEYWIEPLPGSGATIPAFKAQSREHGLHWLSVKSKQFKGHYQMRPRRVEHD